MARTAIPTVTTGDLATAAWANTYLRDNEAAHWSEMHKAHIVEGRLTLESGVPVSSTDQADKTTLYYTPYVGNTIALYNGTSWDLVTFTELSLDISGFTASKPYDIFVYNNSGTATLEGLVWTDGSTRATALAYQDGVLSLTGSLSRRYVGTIYMAADAKCDDSIATRYVWNMYNRVGRQMNTTGLTYNTDQTAAGKLYYVHGLEQVVYAGLGGKCTATAASYCGLYLLFDTASLGSASANAGIWSQTAIELHCNCAYGKQVAEGLRYVALGLNVQTTAGVLSEGYTWAVVEG